MKSNLEWKKWGEHDPLYAVATWEGKERGGPDAWTDEEFYQLGQSDWSDFFRQWQHYGVRLGHCIEIGCGAGRITKQLCGAFQQVTAVDVSQHQLDYAQARIPALNVKFVATDGARLPVADGACDAAFSVHVFQHFESRDDAFSVFREIHRALAKGGTLMIHLPLYELPDTRISNLFTPVLSLEKRVMDFKAALARKRLQKGEWAPVMRRLRFDRQQLLQVLKSIGFLHVETRMFAVQSNHSPHDFIFASKGV